MAKIIIILLVSLVFEAVGVVYLSAGLKKMEGIKQISASEIIRVIKQGATNPQILLGVFFEALFFAGLLYMLSQHDVSLVWPLTSLSFVMTGIAAKIFLHEHISPARWAGICLIMLGAGLITYSEHAKGGNGAAKLPAAAQPE